MHAVCGIPSHIPCGVFGPGKSGLGWDGRGFCLPFFGRLGWRLEHQYEIPPVLHHSQFPFSSDEFKYISLLSSGDHFI